MKDDTAISVKNVSKDFLLPHEKTTSIKSGFINFLKNGRNKKTKQHALKNVSFEVKKGEFFGIVGRNGSGKSTMLKILAEIYRPTKGKTQTNGKLVPFIELGVGFNPELTGRENVYLNGALLGFSKKEIDDKYEDIVKFAELERFMDQKLKNYSSGMQVRLAFSVATRANADILLIDEVLAVGDAEFQGKCYEYFKSLKNSETTVIFVSHDMEAVRRYCSRAVLLDKSKLTMEGETRSVTAGYLRLFNRFGDGDSQDTRKARWGDGRAKFDKVELYGDSVLTNSDNTLKFSASFLANDDIDEIVTGSSISSVSGGDICGTNTQNLNKTISNIKKGSRYKVDWSYPNIFSSGEYEINISLHGPHNINVSDWWDSAIRFKVIKEGDGPFSINPQVSADIKKVLSYEK